MIYIAFFKIQIEKKMNLPTFPIFKPKGQTNKQTFIFRPYLNITIYV